ncbi:uncharacterized protein [Diadema antillarum]|uniref:uncharacterized protein n=1 Tax=Diadema antillarum TaxID=105358 RepID=UPI003A89AF3E
MATQSELAQIQHILGKRRNSEQNPLDLSSRKKSREYLDSHKDVEKRRRDRINTCLETIRSLVPLCHQLPRHRRVDKADLLDLAIIYLRMINQFLERIGVPDIFTAAHQQIGLFTSLEKWLREQGEQHDDVAGFTKDILSFLDAEMQTASQVVASQQTSGNSGSMSTANSSMDLVKQENDSGCSSESGTTSSDEECRTSNHSGVDDRWDDSFSTSSNSSDSSKKSLHSYSFENEGSKNGMTAAHTQPATRSYNLSRDTHFTRDTKPPCVDKAVNTDGSLTNFAWPPESTFTLPILSGKIVLHTPSGISGSNNLNAPVTLHAEIHSCPPPISGKGGFADSKPSSEGSPDCPINKESHAVSSRELSPVNARPDSCTDFPSVNHVPEVPPRLQNSSYRPGTNHQRSLASSTHTSQDTYPERSSIAEPQYKYSHSASIAGSDGRVGPKHSESGEHCAEERAGRVVDVSSVGHPPRPANGCFQKNGPFSKRYLANLCHQIDADNNNEASFTSSRHRGCFPNTASSMKMKSLMVHRHQSQHVPTR